MKILHYSLGFPPYRTGGLTKFCMDLMKQQIKEGYEVSLLWPGEMKLFRKETKIKIHKPIEGIGNYEVINPTPVSFDEGIRDFNAFMVPGDASIYKAFIQYVKPDVIHVHTLMGLHKSFLEVAKENGIRLVFTTHDFFPICPKVTMFRHGQICKSIESCEECGVCNNTALGIKKIQILQSPIYRKFKNNAFVKNLRKKHRDEYLSDVMIRNKNGAVGTADDYRMLRNYYQNMLMTMDVLHFNSTVTKNAYEKVFVLHNSKIINITHADITDHRKRKDFQQGMIRIRYLGPQAEVKGYYLLKEALDKLWKEREDFCLDIHFDPVELSPYMRVHDRYKYEELEKIFDETDVLIAPSIWYETFGYTVLEALSYGVPVIISGTVGAKDILVEGAGIIINNINSADVKCIVKHLTVENLSAMNRRIVESQPILDIKEMANSIIIECYMED